MAHVVLLGDSIFDNGAYTSGGPGIGSIIFSVVWAIIGWVIWSYVTYFIGTRLFSGRATPGELLRTIGYKL